MAVVSRDVVVGTICSSVEQQAPPAGRMLRAERCSATNRDLDTGTEKTIITRRNRCAHGAHGRTPGAFTV
ncbi:hypothetical protein Sros01_03760 [Streptomyces roseochromogenus]|nr:hypothetical protein Sros01_03760 [Streptomyces roseochromogenus]